MLIHHDSTLPVFSSLRFIFDIPSAPVRVAVAPRLITGFDLNAISLVVAASARLDRMIVSLGAQLGTTLEAASETPFGAAFLAFEVVVVPEWLSIQLEATTDIVQRHRALLSASLDIEGYQVRVGGGASAVDAELHPDLVASVGVPVGEL